MISDTTSLEMEEELGIPRALDVLEREVDQQEGVNEVDELDVLQLLLGDDVEGWDLGAAEEPARAAEEPAGLAAAEPAGAAAEPAGLAAEPAEAAPGVVWGVPLAEGPAPPGRPCALIFGDSHVSRAGFRPLVGACVVTTIDIPGATWRGVLPTLHARLAAWVGARRREGQSPHTIALWLGGNDIYPRFQPSAHHLSSAIWADIWGTLTRTARVIGVPIVIIGPTPRLTHDRRRQGEQVVWEETGAFHCFDRAMAVWARRQGGLVTYLSLGQSICSRVWRGRQRVKVVREEAFRLDGVHLSDTGYAWVTARLPSWLRPLAAE